MRHHICNFISHVWNLMIFDNWRFARCTSLTPRAAISFQPWRDSAYQKVEPRFEIWSDTRKFSLFLGHAFILVFSVASRKSLEELKPILELIAEVFSRFNPTWKWDLCHSLTSLRINQHLLGSYIFIFEILLKLWNLVCTGYTVWTVKGCLWVQGGSLSVPEGYLGGWVNRMGGWVNRMGGYRCRWVGVWFRWVRKVGRVGLV